MPMSATAIRILVVDDHTLFRRGLTALLGRDAQLQVVGDAADAGEALRRATELQPDVILLDNHLPGVNGVDALPALREAAPNARVLMLTVSEDEHDLSAALRGGASGYLLKTIEGDALVAAIASAMRGESVIAPEMTGKLFAAYRGAAAGACAGSSSAALSGATSGASASASSGTPADTLLRTAAGALPGALVAHGQAAAGDTAQIAPSSKLGQLSPREREILRAVARGASNKEIARDLGIAETTVKIHVQHVLRKLDVSSRVQAAVIASEHGLV